MKKRNLALLGLSIALLTSIEANAIEIKKPNLTPPKVTTQKAANDKKAANESYKKEYQAKIKLQQEKLNDVKKYDKEARLALASVVLTKEKLAEIKALPSEEFDKALNDEIVNVLTAETYIQDFAEYTDSQKQAYENAATKIQIADNRYKNVSNELTAPLKAIVDGNVSVISSKDELKNAAAMIFGIKKNLGTNSDVKRAIRKVNKENNITITVPDCEKVIYPKEGVIGSINYTLNEINETVNKSNKVIAKILYTQEQQKSLEAIKNNKNLSNEEKTAELKAKAKEYFELNQTDGTIKNSIDRLTPAQKEEFTKAASDVIAAGAEYGMLALQCTKLGFNISRNPLLAAPLTFELGALKDTGKLVKDSSSSLAKSAVQLKKVLKDNNISIANAKSSKTTDVKASGFKKFIPAGFKK